MKKIRSVLFFATFVAAFSVPMLTVSCAKKNAKESGTYTYRTTSIAPSTWSPTDWQMGTEGSILTYTTSSLYEFVMNESKTSHQIVPSMAKELPIDVTKEFAGKAPYSVPADATEGWAWHFDLIENAKWEDGTPISAKDFEYSLQQFINPKMKNYRASTCYQDPVALANGEEYYNGECEWDDVGFIKQGDYSFTIVLEKALTPFMAAYCFSGIMLVKEDLYEANKMQTGDIIKSSYGTEPSKYASYGAFKIASYQADKSIQLVRNENWYGWTDGKRGHNIQTTGIDIQFIVEHATAMNLFLQGKLDSISLDADDLEKYGNSEYRVDTPQTYTVKISINIDKEALKREESAGVNHSILAYKDFRHAFSLAFDRQKYVDTIAPSSEPGFGIINKLYVANPDTGELYRDTEQAKKMLCEFYGTSSVKDITGYSKDEARVYFQKAYDSALAAGDIKSGDKVVADVHVYSDNPINTRSVAFMQEAVNEATKGTDLENRVTFNMVKDEDYYGNMVKGNVDIAFTLWGGNSFDPYALTKCYCDPDVLNEYGFKPKEETLTITLEGTAYTKTFYEWYDELTGGKYSNAAYDIRNTILSEIERGLLETYCMIPYRYMQTSSLDSQRIVNGSDHYINTLVNFGGIEFLTYTMDDAEWDAYCKEHNNHLIY